MFPKKKHDFEADISKILEMRFFQKTGDFLLTFEYFESLRNENRSQLR